MSRFSLLCILCASFAWGSSFQSVVRVSAFSTTSNGPSPLNFSAQSGGLEVTGLFSLNQLENGGRIELRWTDGTVSCLSEARCGSVLVSIEGTFTGTGQQTFNFVDIDIDGSNTGGSGNIIQTSLTQAWLGPSQFSRDTVIDIDGRKSILVSSLPEGSYAGGASWVLGTPVSFAGPGGPAPCPNIVNGTVCVKLPGGPTPGTNTSTIVTVPGGPGIAQPGGNNTGIVTIPGGAIAIARPWGTIGVDVLFTSVEAGQTITLPSSFTFALDQNVVIPEPGTLGLAVSAFAALWLARRRR